MLRPIDTVNQKDLYTRKDSTANYLVCAFCQTFGETKRLDEAIELAEKHTADSSELRIHEYATGVTWYFN